MKVDSDYSKYWVNKRAYNQIFAWMNIWIVLTDLLFIPIPKNEDKTYKFEFVVRAKCKTAVTV